MQFRNKKMRIPSGRSNSIIRSDPESDEGLATLYATNDLSDIILWTCSLWFTEYRSKNVYI